MRESDRYQEPLLRQPAVDNEKWLLRTVELVKRWEKPIWRALDRLAQGRWSSKYSFGVISIKAYRVRYQQVDPEVHLWWVEHEPQDGLDYREAYRVHLVLDIKYQPSLCVQSGETVYPVSPLTEENLQAAVRQAEHDLPLMMPRLAKPLNA